MVCLKILVDSLGPAILYSAFPNALTELASKGKFARVSNQYCNPVSVVVGWR